jgi:hypothetical protein
MTLIDGQVISDFCVMKYEAKAWNLTSDTVDEDGYNGAFITQWTGSAITNTQPRSVPQGHAWTNINWSDARSECQSLGTGYELISDPQWMVVAENILRMPINDLNESTSGTQLALGEYATRNASIDPNLVGCDLYSAADNQLNTFSDTCQIQDNYSTYGYYLTTGNFSQGYRVMLGGYGPRSRMRTHILSNTNPIWDFSGGIGELVNTALNHSGVTYQHEGEYGSIGVTSGPYEPFFNMPWVVPSADDVNSGLGSLYLYKDNGIMPIGARGVISGSGGIFSLEGSVPYTYFAQNLGFRCVYFP